MMDQIRKTLAALVGADVALRRFEVVVPTLHQIVVAKVGAAAHVAAGARPVFSARNTM